MMEMEIETGSRKVGQDDHDLESYCRKLAIDLLPPEMLRSIYKFLSFPELLVCRQVNKKWRSAASDEVKKRGNAVSLGGGDLPKYKRELGLKNLIDCVNATGAGLSGDFPVDKFELSLNSTDCDQSNVRQLLHDVSSFASEITFHFSLGTFPINRTALQSDNLPTFSNLKFLGLEIMGDGIHKNLLAASGNAVVDAEIFNFIRGIIERAPKLEDISLRIFGIVTRASTIPRCIDGFGIRQKKLLSTLKMEASFRNPLDWVALAGLGLKLKHFKVSRMENAGDGVGLGSFLLSQADTLLTLVIDRNGPTDSHRMISVNFPRLPVLQKLKIEVEYQYHEQTRNAINFPTVCYQTQLPALTELCILNSCGGGVSENFIRSEMTPSLTVVKLNLPWGQEDAAVIQQAASLFPNLRKLGLHVGIPTRSLLQEVYTHFSWLEELTLFERRFDSGRCLLDEVISGLREIDCSLAKAPPSSSWYWAIARLESPTNATKSLASLTNLKVLKIENSVTDEKWVGHELNELSGYVVKQMESLQCIDFGIRRYPPPIPFALMDELKKHVDLIHRLPRHRRSAIDKIQVDDYYDFSEDSEGGFEIDVISDPSSNENGGMSE